MTKANKKFDYFLDNTSLSSSLCSIHRQGFGQLERVQLTSYSITIRFNNIFSNLKCSSIHIYVFITNVYTNQLERTIEVNRQKVQNNRKIFFIIISTEHSNKYVLY